MMMMMMMVVVVVFQTDVEVYRRSSPSQPSLDDCEIDWEETVYLNLILQHVSDFTFVMFGLPYSSDHINEHYSVTSSTAVYTVLPLKLVIQNFLMQSFSLTFALSSGILLSEQLHV